jgi:hypothetical protein
MRIRSELTSFDHVRHVIVRLLVCVLVLSLVTPAGCVIAQDAAVRELETARKQLAGLEARLAELEARLAQLQAELERERVVTAQWKAKCDATSAESAQLRAQMLLAQAEQDKGLKSLVETTESLQKVRAENAALKAENKRLHDLAAKAGILPKAEDPFGPVEQAAAPAAAAEGVVLEVKGDGGVVVSLGTKDGLRIGDQLHIYRDLGDYGIYVGRIEITQAQADSATCKVISRQDTPRKGDQVVTRI